MNKQNQLLSKLGKHLESSGIESSETGKTLFGAKPLPASLKIKKEK